MWLVLFDIDGTLVSCGLQIREIFAAALDDVFGTVGDLNGYQFAGRTDDGIVFDLMTGAGLSASAVDERLPEFRGRYLDALENDLDPSEMRLLPHVRELLEQLTGREDVLVGLLTGNWERGARIKLSPFDLNRFFSFGAFGDGERSRDALPPVALERARAVSDREIRVDRTLIVGDSVLDVGCARAHGIASLAVATGFTSAGDLDAAGADWVIEDLTHAGACHPVFQTG
jgi:phosphoglycolate phosphatase-like HAD superfamily hydrolase